MEINCKR